MRIASRAALAVLLAAAAASARAEPRPVVDPKTLPSSELREEKAYPTLEDAAVAALRAAAALSRVYEYGGALLRSDAGYFYTEPVTTGEEKSVSYRTSIPDGFTRVGLYHTHPGGDGSTVFSPADVQQSKALGLPSFIGVFDDDAVRVFTPDMPVWRAPLGSASDWDGIGRGRVVLRRWLTPGGRS